MDLLNIVLLSVLAAYYFEDYQLFVFITMAVIIGLLPMIHSKRLLLFGEELCDKISGKVGNLAKHVIKLLESSAMLLKNKELYGGLILGLIAWGAEGVGFWYTLKLLGAEIDLLMAVSVYGVAILVGALSFLPGGLGGTELVMGLLLVALGVDKPTAVAATLICRIATLWFAVFLGLGVAGGLTMKGYALSTTKAEVE